MSRRSLVLCGVFAMGLIAVGASLLSEETRNYWATTLGLKPDPVAEAKARYQATAATRPASRQLRSASRNPTNRSPAVRKSTLLEELPRQALYIAAAHDFALPVADRSVDFTGATQPLPLSCKVDYTFGQPAAKVVVKDAKGAEVRSIDLPLSAILSNYLDHAKLAASVEPWCQTHYAALLSEALGRPAKPVKDDIDAPVPPDIEALLGQIDAQRSFLAARALHAVIAESGESPARLAALVRAYANLAESTRYLYSRHGSVFFARALLYAERLVRKYPDLALAHAARGYAYTLFGQSPDGRRSLAKANELATAGNAKLPSWADTAAELNRFNTRKLVDRIDVKSPDSPLASYFALLSIEHSGLESVVINLSRLAKQYNPGSLRAVNMMTDNSGVSLQHDVTEQLTTTQFDTLAALANHAAAPDAIKVAAGEIARKNDDPDLIVRLLDQMDQVGAEPGQMLPWGAYASVSRDALYVSGMRRLYFTRRMLGGDSSRRAKAWWPMIKGHRFASVFAGYDETGELAGGNRQAAVEVRGISLDDFYRQMPHLASSAKTLAPPAPGEAERVWAEHYEYRSDDTAYELANDLWAYRGKEADGVPILAGIKGEVAKQLLAINPDHPSGISEVIVNRWAETRTRADEIEREFGGHPQVAFALARAYRADNRFADAARLLERTIALSPDRAAYEELAELYLQQGDDEKWLAVYETFLSKTEDFGLDHAKINEKIAYALLRMKKIDKATRYAERAAESGSSWGLRVLAACLTESGRYADAEALEESNQKRYPASFAWYRWCQATGKGDLKAARHLSDETVAEIKDPDPRSELWEVSIYHAMEGRPDKAKTGWEQFLNTDRKPFAQLQLALIAIEQNRTDDVEQVLEGVGVSIAGLPPELAQMMGGGSVTTPTDEAKNKVYKAAADEIIRCLGDANAVPARNEGGGKTVLDAVGTSHRGNAAYVLGRFCELRNKNEDAEWWYRASLDSGDWTFACRPMAGAGLKRLGTQYYK